MQRPLFGGALSCNIPEDFADVSLFRQVPDNQEVFANAVTDQCVIVELLQFEESVEDAQSARYFFNEIAQSNGCRPNEVMVLFEKKVEAKYMGIDTLPVTQIIVGDQCVAKFKEGDHAKNIVRVYLGNIRLPSVSTDVLVSVSAPTRINPDRDYRGAFQFEDNSEVATIFKQVLQSFAVRDWSLFT